jgi:hypothetical protein
MWLYRQICLVLPPDRGVQVMRLDAALRAEPEQHRVHYEFLDQFYAPAPAGCDCL